MAEHLELAVNSQMQNYKKIEFTRFYAKEHNCRASVKKMCRFDKVKLHRGCSSTSRWC